MLTFDDAVLFPNVERSWYCDIPGHYQKGVQPSISAQSCVSSHTHVVCSHYTGIQNYPVVVRYIRGATSLSAKDNFTWVIGDVKDKTSMQVPDRHTLATYAVEDIAPPMILTEENFAEIVGKTDTITAVVAHFKSMTSGHAEVELAKICALLHPIVSVGFIHCEEQGLGGATSVSTLCMTQNFTVPSVWLYAGSRVYSSRYRQLVSVICESDFTCICIAVVICESDCTCIRIAVDRWSANR